MCPSTLPSCHPGHRARGSRSLVILSGGRGAPGVEGPRRTRRPAAAWKRPGRDDCHPERRARSARSRRTSPDAEACGSVEAPWPGCARVFRPAAPARPESASDPRKSGTQGSMGRYAHRPSCLWFGHLRVRLTKPPQIAMSLRVGPSPGPQQACELRARADPRRLVQVSCGWPRVARDRPAGAPRCAPRVRAA